MTKIINLFLGDVKVLYIGKMAPDFSCDAVIKNTVKRYHLYGSPYRYKLLFFYPLDFTFVCPTELHALQDHLALFEEREVEVLGISVDSVYSHLAWLETPKNKGGIQGVQFPLLADITKSIARQYGVLNEDAGVAVRGVFLIDKDNVIQYASLHNLSIGRSSIELLRVVDALKHVEEFGEVCPANWHNDQKALKPSSEGLREYFG